MNLPDHRSPGPAPAAVRARLAQRDLLHVLGFVILAYGAFRVLESELPALLKLAASAAVGLAFYFSWLFSEQKELAGLDELGRKIRIEANRRAFPAAVAVTFFLGLVEEGGLMDVHPVQPALLIVLMHILSLEWSRRRYR